MSAGARDLLHRPLGLCNENTHAETLQASAFEHQHNMGAKRSNIAKNARTRLPLTPGHTNTTPHRSSAPNQLFYAGHFCLCGTPAGTSTFAHSLLEPVLLRRERWQAGSGRPEAGAHRQPHTDDRSSRRILVKTRIRTK